MRSPICKGITAYVYGTLIERVDDLAEAEINMPYDTPYLKWVLDLEDWRAWELLLDWTGNLDAGGIS